MAREIRNLNHLALFGLVVSLFFLAPPVRVLGQTTASHSSKPKKHAAAKPAQPSDLVQTPKFPGMPFVHVVPYGIPTKSTSLPTSSAGGRFSYWGGPVISNVHIVEVLWGSFVDVPTTTGLPQFLTDIAKTNYFDLLSEYGTVGVTGQTGAPGSNQLIGRGVFDGKFVITPSICPGSATKPPPSCSITDNQIAVELQRQLSHLPVPVTDNQGNYNTMYLLYFPPGVHISLGGTPSCAAGGFCAYHSSLRGGLPSEIPYGVFPDFGPTSGCTSLCGQSTPANNLTSVTSHEIGEAVSDANVGNVTQLGPPLGWFSNNNGDGEIGDVCNQDERQITVAGHTYTVQALFSNVQNTCVIAPAQLVLTGPTGAIPSKAFNLTVSASPSFGGTLTQYSNTVHFTSSDAQAVLPADYTFDPNTDQGTHTFSVTLNSLNSQTVTLADTLAAPITGTATFNVNHNPDLTITKSHTGSFTQGQTGAHYTLTVANVGDLPTTGTVTVADSLPPDLTATALAGTGWACTIATVTCTRADALATSGTYPPITLTVKVSDTAQASIINTAAVAGGGEANTSNNQAADPTTIIQLPDQQITVSDTGNFSQGATGVAYTITVSNIGNTQSTGSISVTDTLPSGLTATSISGQGWNCVLATLRCSRSDTLFPFSNYPPIQLNVNVALNAASPVVDTATVSGGGEANTTNDTGTDPTNVSGPVPDFTVSISHPGTLTEGQTGVTYTLTASNIGPAASSGTVSVADVPGQLVVTAMSGSGWTCTLAPVMCSRSDALAAGPNSFYPLITVTANVPPGASSPLTNGVYVSGGSEINLGNDTDNDSATVNLVPDLTVGSSHSLFAQGQIGATYLLTAINAGGALTQGTVTLTDTLPAGLAATSMSGINWNCTLATLTCTSNTPFLFSFNSITLTVNVDPSAPSSVTNSVAVSGGGEALISDNTASDPTQVLPPVSVTEAYGTPEVTAGQKAGFGFNVFSITPNPVTLSCSGLPAGAGCTFSPTTVTGQGGVGLDVTTTAPTRSSVVASRSNSAPWLIALVPLLGLVFAGRRKSVRRKYTLASVALLCLGFSIGCGGGGSGGGPPPPPTLHGGTPAGTYNITVTAADATAKLQSSTTIQVTVNWNGL